MDITGVSLSMETVEHFLTDYGLRIVGAVITLVLGWLAAKIGSRVVGRVLDGTHLEAILASFLSNLVYIFIITFFVVSALNKLGVQTTSIVAVIGAAGLAIGLALQGSLSNFAAGIMIIFFRHFKVGDVISVNNITGTVVSMSIFTTTLNTFTNERIIVPNQFLTTNPLTNFTGNRTRRVDMLFTVKGDVAVEELHNLIAEVMEGDGRILSAPAYTLEINALQYNGMRYALKFWVKQQDYAATQTNVLEQLVYKAKEKGITLRP